MKKTEGIKLSRIGKILSTVLAKDEQANFLDANERGYVCNAKIGVREMLETEFQKHETAAAEWSELTNAIDQTLSDKDIKEGFDPGAPSDEDAPDDIPGQGYLPGVEDTIPENRKAPSTIRYEEQIDNMLRDKIKEGTSKADAIQQTAAELVCVKGDVEVRFMVLVTEGKIVKEGRKYVWSTASAAQVASVLPSENGSLPPLSVKPGVPLAIKDALLGSVLEGFGKAASITSASRITGENKASLGAYWDQLEREGTLVKHGDEWHVIENAPELATTTDQGELVAD